MTDQDERYYHDTASDAAIAELLLDISTGVGIKPDTRNRLLGLALEFGATSVERHEVKFPVMVVDEEDGGAIAYAVTPEFADRIVDALTFAEGR